MAKPANKPRKKANGYKMPDPLPNGLILEDITKKKWKLGPSIGKGGFGEIYSAQEHADTQKKTSGFPYVVKIEPHENGPLFVEMHFYMRNAKPADIEAFISEKKLPGLGMPKYLGSGSQEHKDAKYRFVVMERFGSDIWKLFLENKRRFPIETVFKLGVQILDVLEYIHSRGYIHADVKGANVLLGLGKEAQTQVYLVDFGLCSHYDSNYKPDPKKAHNGTIEYLSRDAHLGVESRRGDLEILGYNLTQWLGCVLPWEKDIGNPVAVQNSKQKHMDNLPGYFKACFGDDEAPAALVEYFKYVTALKFETNPDYKKLRKILISGVEKAGGSLKSPLKFKSTASTPVKRKALTKSKSVTPQKKAKMSKKVDSELEEDDYENGDHDATKKKRGKKAKAVAEDPQADSESEEDIHDDGDHDGTKKKRGKKTKAVTEEPQSDSDVDSHKNEEKTKKKPGKKSASKKQKEPVVEEPEEATNGYTAEMLRLKNKMDSKKKPKAKKKTSAVVNSDRTTRVRKNVNYNEN